MVPGVKVEEGIITYSVWCTLSTVLFHQMTAFDESFSKCFTAKKHPSAKGTKIHEEDMF